MRSGFAPHLSPNDYALGEMRGLIEQSHGARNYATYIQARTPLDVGTLGETGDAIPAAWNIQSTGSPSENHKFLNQAYDCCQKANLQYGLNLRVAVIGHTHHARIATRTAPNGGLFTLIDCGAWIENCKDNTGRVMENAQIAALSANEARIYQLSGKPG